MYGQIGMAERIRQETLRIPPPASARPRFEASGDVTSAWILDRIYCDEIRHVAIGVRWFRYFCDEQRFECFGQWQKLVRRHFKGSLKPPFNDSARNAAGLTMDFYYPLAASE